MASSDGHIQLGHGGGGRLSQQLLTDLLVPALGPREGVLHDAARLLSPGQQLAFTTDSYVVRPLFSRGETSAGCRCLAASMTWPWPAPVPWP